MRLDQVEAVFGNEVRPGGAISGGSAASAVVSARLVPPSAVCALVSTPEVLGMSPRMRAAAMLREAPLERPLVPAHLVPDLGRERER